MRYIKDPIDWADRSLRGCFGGDGGSGGATGNDSGLGGIGDFGSGRGTGSGPQGRGGDIGGFDVQADTVAGAMTDIGRADPEGPAEAPFNFDVARGIKDSIDDKNISNIGNVVSVALGLFNPALALAAKVATLGATTFNNRGTPATSGTQTAGLGPTGGSVGRGVAGDGQSAGDDSTGPSGDGGGGNENFGLPTTSSPLTGATVEPTPAQTPEQLAAEEEAAAAEAAQIAADSEAFESTRLAVVESERVAREKEAEETSRLRAEEAASNVRSNSRPQAASSDPIRLLAPNPDNDGDTSTPQQRARFLTSGGPLGLTGTRANVRRPTLFGA